MNNMKIVHTFLSLMCLNIYVGNVLSNSDISLELKYLEMNEALKKFAKNTIQDFLREFLEARESMNLSSNCFSNIFKIMAGVRNLESWAISFLDSSGKLMDGSMSGNSHMLGNYDQCLASTAKKKNGNLDFSGHYCSILYKPYLPDPEKKPALKDQLAELYMVTRNVSEVLRFYLIKSQFLSYYMDTYGLCVPSGCNKKDVQEITKHVGDMIYLNLTVQYCHTEADTPGLDSRKLAVICIFSFAGLLCLIGTIFDYCLKLKNSEIRSITVKTLLCFSITRNFPRLINTDISDAALSCLSGVRVLTIFYIILGHHYISINLFYMQTNLFKNMSYHLPGFFTQIVLNGFLSVDIFFLLGGFINSYTRIKEKEMVESQKRPWVIILYRLWRLYPAYIFSILLVFLLTARGPLSQTLEEKYIKKCSEEWWKNILFINNFFDQAEVCLSHTWYLACDMQYFLISLVTVPFLISNPKKGILVNLGVILCGLLSTAIWVYMDSIPPTFVFRNVNQKDLTAVVNAYIAPCTHAAPYFIGILGGYMMRTKKYVKIPKVYQVTGWIAASISFTSMLFMTVRWNSGSDFTPVESVLYFTFSRPLYSLPVAWMIFCCMTGHGGFINFLLSLKIWIPLSRISFMLYLISFPIQLFYRANLRTTTDTHRMVLIWEYFGDLCVSCLLSLAMVLIIESPMLSLQKIAFKKGETEDKQQEKTLPKNGINLNRNCVSEIIIGNERNVIQPNIHVSNFM